MGLNNTTPFQVTVISSISAAGVSTTACLVALGALLCFKMYRHFIYRLLLYTLAALAVFSLSELLFLTQVMNNVASSRFLTFVEYMYSSSYCTALLLMNCTIFSIHEPVLYHRWYNKWIYDLNCLLISIFAPIPYGVLATCDESDHHDNISPMLGCSANEAPLIIFMILMLGVSSVFVIGLTMSLCSQMCRYKRNVAVRPSQQQTLREKMPLVIPPIITLIHAYLVCVLYYLVPYFKLNVRVHVPWSAHLITGVLGGLLGLVAALAIAMHVCILGKVKCLKLRTIMKKRVHAIASETISGQQRSYGHVEDSLKGVDTLSSQLTSQKDVEKEFLNELNNQQ